VARVARIVARDIVSKVLEDEVGWPDWDHEPAASSLVNRAFAGEGPGDLDCTLRLRRPIVGIGAPVTAYLPAVAGRLNTDLVIPDHAEVANAVGAVAGGVIKRRQVVITPVPGEAGQVRVFLPDGVHTFTDLEEAVRHARRVMEPLIGAMARDAGAEQVEIQFSRNDQWAPAGTAGGSPVFVGRHLRCSAAGRPSPAR